jgi:hypothetical protein
VTRLAFSSDMKSQAPMPGLPPLASCSPCEHESLTLDDESPALSEDDSLCPICLECPSQAVSLPCSHTLCNPCFVKLCEHNNSERRVPCPCCKSPFALDNGSPISSGAVQYAEGQQRGRSHQHGRAPWWTPSRPQTADDRLALERAAGRLSLRACPSCKTPIEKDGGCESMSCPCGTSFEWLSARPVSGSCSRCHVDEDAGWRERWRTCRYCSRTARAQAAAGRAAVATAIVPLAAAAGAAGVSAIAIGAVAAVLPAATVGPLALAYEPVRRLRKAHNPFAKVATSGAKMAGLGAMLCFMWLTEDAD